jgi:hypothetical protein
MEAVFQPENDGNFSAQPIILRNEISILQRFQIYPEGRDFFVTGIDLDFESFLDRKIYFY